MKATLTVNKAELRAKLVEQVEHMREHSRHARDIREIREALEMVKERETSETFSERMAEYYSALADGIRSNTIHVNAAGKLAGVVPNKPIKNRTNRFARYSRTDLERTLADHEHWLRSSLKPIETAIELLDLAQGESVEIDASDYQNLLSNVRY